MVKHKKGDASKKELLWKKQDEEKRAKEMQQKLAKQEAEEKANMAGRNHTCDRLQTSSLLCVFLCIGFRRKCVECSPVLHVCGIHVFSLKQIRCINFKLKVDSLKKIFNTVLFCC